MKTNLTLPNKLFRILNWILILITAHFIVIENDANSENKNDDYDWPAYIGISILLIIVNIFVDKIASSSMSNWIDFGNRNYRFIYRQLVMGFIIPFITFTLAIVIYGLVTESDYEDRKGLNTQLFVLGIFLYIINGIRLNMYLDQQLLSLEKVEAEQKNEAYNDKVIVYHKGAYMPLNLYEIAIVYQSQHINWIITFQDEEHILNLTLTEIFSLLSPKQFFKINRTQIINKDSIKKFNSGDFGKIELELKNGLSARVSKDRAAAFRKWLVS